MRFLVLSALLALPLISACAAKPTVDPLDPGKIIWHGTETQFRAEFQDAPELQRFLTRKLCGLKQIESGIITDDSWHPPLERGLFQDVWKGPTETAALAKTRQAETIITIYAKDVRCK